MGTIPRFIKVRKDNQARDRGFIAVDAICSVFENKENHNVSIMTMDGFWYDVDDDVDELYDLVTGKEKKEGQEPRQPQPQYLKKDYFRRKKMMPAMSENDGPKRRHEDFSRADMEMDDSLDVFRPAKRKSIGRKPNGSRDLEKDLPAGAGEGHFVPTPEVETPPFGEVM